MYKLFDINEKVNNKLTILDFLVSLILNVSVSMRPIAHQKIDMFGKNKSTATPQNKFKVDEHSKMSFHWQFIYFLLQYRNINVVDYLLLKVINQ